MFASLGAIKREFCESGKTKKNPTSLDKDGICKGSLSGKKIRGNPPTSPLSTLIAGILDLDWKNVDKVTEKEITLLTSLGFSPVQVVFPWAFDCESPIELLKSQVCAVLHENG
eukprot:TRINITY_DN1552_c0_g1_i7.p1 TRINITY_DN1552_c0_g1~~TRINITY_DN1552_c0_g1_i7.p1  ORF type:complete len:113 (+),score=26.02 TRINITY_DN1552_c0_g1_i7:427-765(+)